MKNHSLVKRFAIFMLASLFALPLTANSFAASSGWKQNANKWKYYDAEGKYSTGWLKLGNDWYYLNPTDGVMKTGWLNTADGKWYFFSNIKDSTEGKMLTGWQWIDGNSYYFETVKNHMEGSMYAGTKTPDGYIVNSDGRWVDETGKIQTVAGKGYITKKLSTDREKSSKGGSGGFSRGGSGGSSLGGGSHNAGGNTHISNTIESTDNTIENEDSLLVKENTKLIDLGWAQYVSIGFKKGNLSDYTVYIDGTDITQALTKVDDNATLVKWLTTVVSPKNLKVLRKSDNKEEILKLAQGDAILPVDAGSSSLAPAYILTNGPVSVFDYYLNVYDKDGRIRVSPAYTTFDIEQKRPNNKSDKIPTKYYLPDVEFDTQESRGEIVAKFSLENTEHEAWFNGIKQIKILTSENRVLNDNLVFEKEIDTTYGKTAVFKIPLRAGINVNHTGRYQLNFVSDFVKETVTLPLHLVNRAEFVMQLDSDTPNPGIGEDIVFNIVGKNGESFGNEILSAIYRVDLSYPSGKEYSLEKISEYYQIGNRLHIEGRRKDESLIIDESGIYTVTVYADGYKTIKKRVEIRGNSTQASTQSLGVDTVSSASLGGGSINITPDTGSGSSSSSGSGRRINAYLLFEHDLIANALILNELGILNEDARKVVEAWFGSQTPEAALDAQMETLYLFDPYLDYVKDARLEQNKQINFAEYILLENRAKRNYPNAFKRVLEDGLLGATSSFYGSMGIDAPEFSGLEIISGQNFEIAISNNEDYISKIKNLYIDGSQIPLRSDNYLRQFSIENGKIIIYPEAFNGYYPPLLGEHELRIEALGYKDANLRLTVRKELEEFEFVLADNPERRDDEDAKLYYTNQDIHIIAGAQAGAKAYGDFIASMQEITLRDTEGRTRRVLSSTEGSLGGNDNYSTVDNKLVLGRGLFNAEGEYTVYVKSQGYAPMSLTFTLQAMEEDPGTGEIKQAPTVSSITFHREFFGGNYYLVKFSGDEEEIAQYLSKEKVLKINGRLYENSSVSFDFSGDKYMITNDPVFGGRNIILKISASNITEGSNTVNIITDGYNELNFDLTPSNNAGNSGSANAGTGNSGADNANSAGEGDNNAGNTGTGGSGQAGSDTGSDNVGGSGNSTGSGETDNTATLKAAPSFVSYEFKRDVFFPEQSHYLVKLSGTTEELNEYLTKAEQELTVNGVRYEYIQSESYFNKVVGGKYSAIADETQSLSGPRVFLKIGSAQIGDGARIVYKVEGYTDLKFNIGNVSNLPSDEDVVDNDNHENPTDDSNLKDGFRPTIFRKDGFGLFEKYEMIFADNTEVHEFLNALREGNGTLKIDGEAWTRKNYVNYDNKEYEIKNEDSGASRNYSRITMGKAFNQRGTIEVEISVQGYNPVNFRITNGRTIE